MPGGRTLLRVYPGIPNHFPKSPTPVEEILEVPKVLGVRQEICRIVGKGQDLAFPNPMNHTEVHSVIAMSGLLEIRVFSVHMS